MQNFKEYQFFYCTDYKITYNYELNSILFNFGSSNFHANHYNNIIYPIAHANAADIIETNNAGISVHVHINVCLLIVY